MFTHLHVHTEYSLLDGMCRIPELVTRARELGMESLAITDHGALHGAVSFYLACRSAGLKPIIGCELYVAPQGRQSRTPADKSANHLVVLARDQTGFHNLIQLVTKAHLDGFYYKPRVDKELLAQHHQGLVALSACPQGEVGRLFLEGRADEAAQAARWYSEVFGDFYLEVQGHPIPEVARANEGIVALARQLHLPLVATNDVHYVNRAQARLQDVLLCIQTNSTVQNEKRMRLQGDSFYLKSPQEMADLFSELPEALANTERIAEMCGLELELGRVRLPKGSLPPGQDPDEFLGALAWEGLRARCGELSPAMKERLAYELDVIRQTRFANYFLVVWDIIAFVRRRDILFGVRGSAAASLVLYAIGVTDINPLDYGLVFERFLNLERHELPDIDMDFQDDRRDEVISYVTQKYGADHVAQIITFGTLGARAALRDVGRALGMTYSDVDRVARLVPPTLNITLDRALEENQELRQAYQVDPTIRELVDTARGLEGVSRHASTHAAGVVISEQPLTDIVPLQRTARGEENVMTQFAMEDIARLGLLKMDFLGLANLTILDRARKGLAQRGTAIDLHALPPDDPKAYQLLASGETTGVFQLEGSGMRRVMRELKPTCFGDIAALVALYRPGPMQHIPTFIQAKHGLSPVRYPHPVLAPILQETYGVIVYQDQVLFIVQALAGYSLGQADIVRKAMGKKIAEVMQKEKGNFLAGAAKKGFSPEVAAEVWALIEPFAGYAFNKAHSVSYAMIAYQTAYLKANYPAEFMAALLSIHMGQAERVATAVSECHRLDLQVLPPDINRSQEDFTIERDGAIRFGLGAVKNVGGSALKPVFQAREAGGPFTSVEDLARRADLRGMNKRTMESLIKAGALDPMGSRGALLAHVDRIIALSATEQRLKETGQATMFDLWGEKVATPLPGLDLGSEDASPRDKLAWEKELLGVYLSARPVTQVTANPAVTAFCHELDADMEGQKVVLGVVVTSVRELRTREGRAFAIAVVEDMGGSLEATAWPEVYEATRELWVEGNTLLLKGRVRVRQDQVGLVCERASFYQASDETPVVPSQQGTQLATESEFGKGDGFPVVPFAKGDHRGSAGRRLRLALTPTGDAARDAVLVQDVFEAIARFPGSDEVLLVIPYQGQEFPLEAPSRAGYCPQLASRLEELAGPGALRVE